LPLDGPGFSAAVLCDRKPVFELHHGMASLELKVPLASDSAYYLASESKQFTAACVLSLARAGAIALDDDVCAHLPELANFDQPFPLLRMSVIHLANCEAAQSDIEKIVAAVLD
jgi:CubicO group peptidase (beta-lactamase class C family)